MTGLMVEGLVRSGDIVVTTPHYSALRKRHAELLGDGTLVGIFIGEFEEACKHRHHKYLHGHLLKPVSELTGYTETWWKKVVKRAFLPEGMRSTTQMNAEQFDEFNLNVELALLAKFPEAFDRSRRNEAA